MRKNYVESSLKRFLKRKVKITMGFVVAFMIMGTGVFAESAIQIKDGTEKEFKDIVVTETEFMVSGGSTKSGILINNNSKGIFNGENIEIKISNQDTNTKTAGVAINGGGVGIFNAKNTIIDVNSIGGDGKWGFGLILETNGKAEFNGENVTINNYQKNYTSQTLTVNKSQLDFNNKGDVNISSKSEFGVTGISSYGKLTFNNTGNVNIYGEILPGGKTGQTNVVGIQSTGAEVTTTVTDKVNNFNIILKGAGVDNDGTSYSTGTKAITMSDGSKFDVNSKTFNIKMEV